MARRWGERDHGPFHCHQGPNCQQRLCGLADFSFLLYVSFVSSEYLCPHCGVRVDTSPDPGGGDIQEYIEDCPVCCRPNRIAATLTPLQDEYAVEVSSEI